MNVTGVRNEYQKNIEVTTNDNKINFFLNKCTTIENDLF